jgi:SAM-dependent methyltransferase
MFNRLKHRLRRVRDLARSRWRGGPRCGVCGFVGEPTHHAALWPELVAEWELNPQWADWFDQREGSQCFRCGASLRVSQMADALVDAVNLRVGTHASRLDRLFDAPAARMLSIAELNSAGNLHRYLARCPGLRHSEFGSTSPNVPSEDLLALSYADASFDLVVTSDTLEHVPEIDTALRETLRVLKPGGTHVFSVPVVWDRPTRQRAVMNDGEITHLLPPSYHGQPAEGKSDYLVFYEFGADFVERCTVIGYEVRLLKDAVNPALVTFIARRPG